MRQQLLRDAADAAGGPAPGAGRLDPSISVTASWSRVDEVARDLLDRRIKGKAVLTID